VPHLVVIGLRFTILVITIFSNVGRIFLFKTARPALATMLIHFSTFDLDTEPSAMPRATQPHTNRARDPCAVGLLNKT